MLQQSQIKKNMLKKICPCLDWFYQNVNNKLVKKVGYQPGNQFEQDQFNHTPEHAKTKQLNNNQLIISQQIPIEQQIENTLLQYNKHQIQAKSNQRCHKPQQFAYSNDESKMQEDETNEQYQKTFDFSNLGELQINISEHDENYQLLKEKTSNAAELLDVSMNCTELLLYQKKSCLNSNKAQLRVWKTKKNNCFIFQYQMPCSYAFYNQIAHKKILPNDKKKLIRQYRLIESIDHNLAIRYICFNKIGMLEPRQFTYLKYTVMSNTNLWGHWQVCISKQNEKQKKMSTSAKQGKLFSITYIIEEYQQSTQPEDKKGVKIKLRTYINLSINSSVDKIWELILMEMKQYVQEMWEEVQYNYSEELV